ncbi:MAG: FtsX-like permease family protein [Anaerolineae bacterium]
MLRLSLLAFRSLWTRPSRTFLTTFAIVLGVAVILAISITNLSTLDAITTLFSEASGRAHLVVTSQEAGEGGFPAVALQRTLAVPGIQRAIPSVQVRTSLVSDGSSPLDISFFGAVAGGLVIYGIDPDLDVEAREYRLVGGQFLSADLDAFHIVLVSDYAAEKDVEVGDDLDIVTPQGVETLRVVGLMSEQGAGQLNNGAFGVIPLHAAQEIFDRVGDLDQIDIVAAPQTASGARLDELKAALQTRLGDDYSVTYPAARGKRVTQMLDGYQIGFNFFGVVALFVGAFLIFNAFSMTVVERTREIGMLRTVGMTQAQIMQQILAEAALLGSVGSALGVGAGLLLSRGLIRIMELILAQEVREVHVPLDGLVTSVIVGICMTLIATAIPAWQAGRIAPLEALRVRGNPRERWIIRRGWVLGLGILALSYLLAYHIPLPSALEERMGHSVALGVLLGGALLIPVSFGAWERLARPMIGRIYGSEGQLGSRNSRRSKTRTTLTVAALMVGVAMILSIRAVTGAFEIDIRSWLDKYIGGDLYVHASSPMRADLAPRLEAVEGVAAVAPIRYFGVERVKTDGTKEDLSFMAIDPALYRRVTSFAFAAGQGDPHLLLQRLAAGDAVFVSSVLSEKYGLGQGDIVRLVTRHGVRDFEVAGVVVDFYNRGMVIQGSWRDMRRQFRVDDVSAFLLSVAPEHSVDAVQARIDRLYGERRHLTVDSNEALSARAIDLLSQTAGLFDVLALIAMIVGALGVINTLTMNVLERRQEIGMLRSVGMTRRQVAKMILAEAAMMGIAGGAFGLAFGLLMSRIVVQAMNAVTGYDLGYFVPSQGLVVSLFIALIVSQLAALWPARRAASTNIIEAIQFE